MRVSCCWVSCRLMALVSLGIHLAVELIQQADAGVDQQKTRFALSSSLTVSCCWRSGCPDAWPFWNS